MAETVSCTWIEKMAFETEVSGHKIVLDAAEEVGGDNRGPRPKALLLSSLAGCTGMDVIYLLRKMRNEPGYFNLVVEAELAEEHPKIYEKIHLIYEFKETDGLIQDKVQTAVEMSQEKYCGVSALLKRGSKLTYEVRYI